VQDEVGAELERLLSERGGEGVVDHGDRAGLARLRGARRRRRREAGRRSPPPRPAGGRALLEVSRGPLELWSWTLEPGESHVSDAHHPGALELVKVRRGTLVLEIGDESVQVKAGHSVWFDASRRHAYRNATTTPVTFVLVVFDPAANRTTELA
jgi:quercetin dioxygenase-like cupin family protein